MVEDVFRQFKYLMKKGADVTAVNINGKNAVSSVSLYNSVMWYTYKAM